MLQNTLKHKIVNNIVAPVANSHSAIFSEATVLDTDESFNRCKIEFNNSEGIKSIQENATVQMYNSGLIDWFPKVGDTVTITLKGSDCVITGPSYKNTFVDIKRKTKLTQDIFTDSFIDTVGGYIF